MRVAEDDQPVFPAGGQAFDMAVEVGDKNILSFVRKNEGGFLNRPEGFQGIFQAFFFAVAVAEDGFDGAPGPFQDPGREGGDEIAGVDNQPAFGIPKKSDGPPYGVQVVVGVG
jgi:hypothetical protein